MTNMVELYKRGGVLMNDKNKVDVSSGIQKWMNLTKKEVKHLFAYYIFLLSVSFIWFIFDLLYHYSFNETGFSIVIGVLLFAFPCGIVGASIYYIRKLYKSCLQDLVVDLPNDDYHKLGAKMYFYIRPIISGILAVLINIGIIGGFYMFVNNMSVNDERFFVFVSLTSFYIGYCNGKLILKLDENGEKLINSIFKENKNG